MPLVHRLGQFILRVSPKGMTEATEKRLVGAGLVGRVSTAAFIGGKVHLDLWVTVWPRWRKDPAVLARLGLPLPSESHR